jgi:hypothetical protein
MEGSGSKSESIQIMPDLDPGCTKTYGPGSTTVLLRFLLDRFSLSVHTCYLSVTNWSHVSPAGDERDIMGMTRAPACLDYCAMMGDEV